MQNYKQIMDLIDNLVLHNEHEVKNVHYDEKYCKLEVTRESIPFTLEIEPLDETGKITISCPFFTLNYSLQIDILWDYNVIHDFIDLMASQTTKLLETYDRLSIELD